MKKTIATFIFLTLPSVASGNLMRDINRLRQKEFPNLDPIQKVLDFPLCKLKIRINDLVSTPRHVQFSFKMQS